MEHFSYQKFRSLRFYVRPETVRHRCALGEICARAPQYTYNALTKSAQRFSSYKMILRRGAYRVLVGETGGNDTTWKTEA